MAVLGVIIVQCTDEAVWFLLQVLHGMNVHIICSTLIIIHHHHHLLHLLHFVAYLHSLITTTLSSPLLSLLLSSLFFSPFLSSMTQTNDHSMPSPIAPNATPRKPPVCLVCWINNSPRMVVIGSLVIFSPSLTLQVTALPLPSSTTLPNPTLT